MSEEIPKQCKAGVVVNEGPDFKVEVQMVDVPEPSEFLTINVPSRESVLIGQRITQRTMKCSSGSMPPASACPIYTS